MFCYIFVSIISYSQVIKLTMMSFHFNVSNVVCPFALQDKTSGKRLGDVNNGVGLNGRFPSCVLGCSFGTPFLPNNITINKNYIVRYEYL